ncbi:unnamed protein product, partial [Porites lobata]
WYISISNSPLHLRTPLLSSYKPKSLPSFSNLALIFKFFTKRNTKAVIRNSLSQELKSVIRIIVSILGIPFVVKNTASPTASMAWPFFISTQHSPAIVSEHSSELGQFLMGSDSHDGPFHHNTLLFNLAAPSPRDPMSA